MANDRVLVRDLLAAILAVGPVRYRVVEQVAAGKALAACQQRAPEVLILDVHAGTADFAAWVKILKRRSPKTRILLTAGVIPERDLVAALCAGVDGCIDNETTLREFFDALQQIASGGNHFCTRSKRLLSEIARGQHRSSKRAGSSNLTRREQDVLALIVSGHSSKEIAAKLHLSVATVETHRASLRSKSSSRNVAGLISYGIDRGLVHRRGEVRSRLDSAH